MSNYVTEMGFSSDTDLYLLVSSVPMGTEAEREAYRAWLETDGTKAGIVKLLQDAAIAKASA